MSDYTVSNGKIFTVACEINLTHHCNLSCRSCGHLSPVAPIYYSTVTDIERDLGILSKYFHSEYIRLLGGEPLLHPKILDFISIVRKSGISDRIRINTNGVLLSKMPDEFWKIVDEVHVSVKPGREMKPDDIIYCKEQANRHQKIFELFFFDRFREGYSEIGTENKELIQRIYSSCYLSHRWHCHTVYQGRFYKCSQSFFLPSVLNKSDLNNPVSDSIELTDHPHFLDMLLGFLTAPAPLKSCKYCLGTVGKLFTLEQIKRKEWRSFQNSSLEDLVDLEYLHEVESDPSADQKCLRT